MGIGQQTLTHGFCVTYITRCFNFDSIISGTFTIQNVGNEEEPDLYTFKKPSGTYLMVTRQSYKTR